MTQLLSFAKLMVRVDELPARVVDLDARLNQSLSKSSRPPFLGRARSPAPAQVKTQYPWGRMHSSPGMALKRWKWFCNTPASSARRTCSVRSRRRLLRETRHLVQKRSHWMRVGGSRFSRAASARCSWGHDSNVGREWHLRSPRGASTKGRASTRSAGETRQRIKLRLANTSPEQVREVEGNGPSWIRTRDPSVMRRWCGAWCAPWCGRCPPRCSRSARWRESWPSASPPSMRSWNGGHWSGCGSGAPSVSRPRPWRCSWPRGGAEGMGRSWFPPLGGVAPSGLHAL